MIRHQPPHTSALTTPARPTGRLRRWWGSVIAAIGAVSGIAPHVLHHVGPLAGTALVAGAGGTALFGAFGLAASVPFLLRLHRRFGTWWAPALALAVFAAMFALSAYIIGPAISGGTDAPRDQPAPTGTDHSEHHGS
jgi:hypothetical protein